MKHKIQYSFIAILLASSAPALALEGSHCTIDAPDLLMRVAAPGDSGAAPSGLDGRAADQSAGPINGLFPAVDLDHSAAVAHIKKSGAEVRDLGLSHGLQRLSASHSNQFMLFQLSPDGEAVVAGLASDISLTKLQSIPGAQITDLGEAHGLAGYYLQNGPEFQVLYETPDHAAMISGVMWEMSGDTTINITKGPGCQDRGCKSEADGW
jgi:thiol:disulfide interchange protein DsbG